MLKPYSGFKPNLNSAVWFQTKQS